MTTTTVTAGGGKTLKVTFTVSGVPVDPTTVTLTVLEPDGVQTQKTGGELTHVSASPANGLYAYDHIFTKPGRHFIHWDGDGVEAAVHQEIYVKRKVTV